MLAPCALAGLLPWACLQAGGCTGPSLSLASLTCWCPQAEDTGCPVSQRVFRPESAHWSHWLSILPVPEGEPGTRPVSQWQAAGGGGVNSLGWARPFTNAREICAGDCCVPGTICLGRGFAGQLQEAVRIFQTTCAQSLRVPLSMLPPLLGSAHGLAQCPRGISKGLRDLHLFLSPQSCQAPVSIPGEPTLAGTPAHPAVPSCGQAAKPR